MTRMNKTFTEQMVFMTVTLLIVKVLSALYRVPYQNILGDEGLYVYNQIYPFIGLCSICALYGIPSAYAEYLKRGFIFRSLHVLLFLCFIVVLSILIHMYRHILASWMGDDQLSSLIEIVAIIIPITIVLGMIRGIFHYHQYSEVVSISQLVEQIVRVIVIAIAIYLYFSVGLSLYTAAKVALFGSVLGMILTTFVLFMKYRHIKGEHYNIIYMNTKSSRYIEFFILMIAFILTHILMLTIQSIDAFTVLNFIGSHWTIDNTMAAKGVFDRSYSFIQIGLIVATTFGFILIPYLDATNISYSLKLLKKSIKWVMLFSTLATVGLINIMPMMNQAFFKTNQMNGELSLNMITIIVVSIAIVLMSYLLTINAYKVVMSGFATMAVVKVFLNMLLLPIVDFYAISLANVMAMIIFNIILFIVLNKHIAAVIHDENMLDDSLSATETARLLTNKNEATIPNKMKKQDVLWGVNLFLVCFIMTLLLQAMLYIFSPIVTTRLDALILMSSMVLIGAAIVLVCIKFFELLTVEEATELPVIKKIIK